MAPKALKDFFYFGGMKNKTMHHTYCKACVDHHLESTGASTADLIEGSQAFKDGSTRGEKTAWIAHLIGGKVACPRASKAATDVAKAERQALNDAKEEKKSNKKRPRSDSTSSVEVSAPPAKKPYIQSTLAALTFRRNDMPFGTAEAAALQKQALRAVVSSGAPFGIFEDPEMRILFGMLRTTAPDVIPTGKVVGGRLLNEAAEDVEAKLKQTLKNRNIGLSTDGWKKKRDSINAICANVDFKSYLLELVEMTAMNKDGSSQCDQFADMIDRVELRNGCIVIYFTTDAEGGSKKGRILLGKKRPWLILPSCWAHQLKICTGINLINVKSGKVLRTIHVEL
ncbi:hypothetical protein B0H11DRAFT_2352378 [Mycena galericulata]|nr:hypothetical protein B0H11DRAFT_2352378 [Mycena galericulata]